MSNEVHRASFSIQQVNDTWRLVIFDRENQVKDIIENYDPELIVGILIAITMPLEFVKELNAKRASKKQKLARF